MKVSSKAHRSKWTRREETEGGLNKLTLVLIEPPVNSSLSDPESPTPIVELGIESTGGGRVGIIEGDDNDGRLDGLESLGVGLGDRNEMVSSLVRKAKRENVSSWKEGLRGMEEGGRTLVQLSRFSEVRSPTAGPSSAPTV